MGRVQAIGRLRVALANIEAEYREEERRRKLGASEERLAAALSLGAVCDLVHDLGWSDAGLDAHLLRLLDALRNLEDGTPSAMLAPAKPNGKPPVPDTIMGVRGRMAAVQDLLMKAGRSEEEAATFVLRAVGRDFVDRLRWHDHKGAVGWKTVKRWRDAVTGSRAEPGSPAWIARSGFDTMTDIIVAAVSDGQEMDAVARKVLSALKRLPEFTSPPARKSA